MYKRVALVALIGLAGIAASAPKAWTQEAVAAEPTELVQICESHPPEEAMQVRTYLGSYYITGYDICEKCCGKTDGITASGAVATVGRTVAAPKDIPFGTTLYIEGIGERVVEDRGGAIKGNHLDVLCEDHPACYAVTGWCDGYRVEG